MPWMVPARVAARVPIPPVAALWAVAAVTVALAWRVRRQPSQGSLVLTGSLLIVAWLLLTLR